MKANATDKGKLYFKIRDSSGSNTGHWKPGLTDESMESKKNSESESSVEAT